MISIGDVIALVQAGWDSRKLRAKIREWQSDRIIAKADDRESPELYEFLFNVYNEMRILVGPDGPFPVAILPLSTEAQSNLDRLSIDFVPTPSPTQISGRDLISALKRRNAKIWNGKTFCLSALRFDKTGAVDGIKGYLGTYYDMVNTADYLEYELLAAVHSRTPFALDDLPARSEAIKNFASPSECLCNGGGVEAAIAISTLVVYARGKEYWLLCDVRSKQVAVHSNLYHVIPSFMYQPVTAPTENNLAIERLITHNIYREYLEELFRVPEVENVGKPISADFFYGHPNLSFLRTLLASGGATLEGVALAFNLLNHRPEICSLMLIRDEKWFERQQDAMIARREGLEFINLNDEFLLSETESTGAHPELITTLPLNHDRWREVARPWMMVPPGGPALILGAKLAASRTGQDEPSWLRGYTLSSHQ